MRRNNIEKKSEMQDEEIVNISGEGEGLRG